MSSRYLVPVPFHYLLPTAAVVVVCGRLLINFALCVGQKPVTCHRAELLYLSLLTFYPITVCNVHALGLGYPQDT